MKPLILEKQVKYFEKVIGSEQGLTLFKETHSKNIDFIIYLEFTESIFNWNFKLN